VERRGDLVSRRFVFAFLCSILLIGASVVATSVPGAAASPVPDAAGSPVLVATGASPGAFDTVVIDAGHGGDDHGARGANGLLEKQLVLDIARQLTKRLQDQGLNVVMTRSEDRFVPLEERTSIANDARGSLFVSIHANASHYRGVRGIETFFASLDASDEAARKLAEAENLAFSRNEGVVPATADPLFAILGDLIATEHLMESQEFARLAQRRLATAEAARSRGVKQAPFVVLMGVQMPAVLVEIGFLTNPEEERVLRRESERSRLVEGLAESVAVFRSRYDARRGLDTPEEPGLPAKPDATGASLGAGGGL
jgi:N-acetylmuramoyl-L-alanine amidase